MDREFLKGLTKEEKVELVKKFANGNIRKVGRQYIDMTDNGFIGILSTADGKKYANGDRTAELTDDFFKEYEGSSIEIPDNGRDNW
ncbi:hypothetical protein [uncultured Draconibacterium sp.]|mgnify:CR=1 FL=1|uniref:hypothetical protein n=1 Tax=uncultured Draconibacterium sp. TaxID=1573823 RepID=UPI0025D58353|nr:hypothetical protein [uncultured Draconibacterium sp.]